MGKEALCTVRADGREVRAKAHLDSAELTVSGDLRLRVPFAEMTSVEARDGCLVFAWRGERVVLELGAERAARWAHSISHPKSRLEKLGIVAGRRVCVLGCDESFIAELSTALGQPPAKQARGTYDAVFYGVRAASDLGAVARLAGRLDPAGALWLVYAKGRGAPVPERAVREALLAAGLVDTKVVAFSATHTAVKAVIPVAARRAKRA